MYFEQNRLLTDRIATFSAGNDAALPSVYECFAGQNRTLICAAGTVLADRMEKLSPLELPRFLERMGEYTSLEWYHEWKTVEPERLRQTLDEREYFSMLALGSAHPNGWYREKCVRALGKCGGDALPFLLSRVNDWAQPVRELACMESERLLESCALEEALAALPYLYRLEHGRRRSEETYTRLMEIAERRLSTTPELLAPEKVLRLSQEGRRLCYRIALRNDSYTPEQWTMLFFKEPDPHTRRKAACVLLDSPMRKRILSLLLIHRDGQLRFLALQDIYDRLGADWDGYEQFLCDTRGGVRELVRFALRQQDSAFDAAAYYRSHLTGATLTGALLGLGETGESADSVQIRSFLDFPQLRVQKAALTALGRIDGTTEQETFYRFLLGGGGLSKVAFRILRGAVARVDCTRSYNDLLGTDDPKLQRRLCDLIGRGGAWESLPWLLRLWNFPDTEVTMRVRVSLEGWQPGFLSPSSIQFHTAQQALDEQRSVLPASLLKQLEFAFAHSGR